MRLHTHTQTHTLSLHSAGAGGPLQDSTVQNNKKTFSVINTLHVLLGKTDAYTQSCHESIRHYRFFLDGGAERKAERGANRQISSNGEREGERHPDATNKAVITHPNLTPTGTHKFRHNYSKVWQKSWGNALTFESHFFSGAASQP